MTSYGPLLQFALLSGFVLAVTLTLLIGACERPLRRALSGKTPISEQECLGGCW